jgi:hypothetical protein
MPLLHTTQLVRIHSCLSLKKRRPVLRNLHRACRNTFRCLCVFGREHWHLDSGHIEPQSTYPVGEPPRLPVSHHMLLQYAQTKASTGKPQNIVQDKRVVHDQKKGDSDSMIPFRPALSSSPSFWKTGIHRILRDLQRLLH